MKKQFIKKHLLLNYSKNNNKIMDIYSGQFAIYFLEGGILYNNEFKALLFFLKKRLKFFSKLFIRFHPNYKNTSKPIGIRMGKGKGPLDEYYFRISKGQIFIEFGFSNKLLILNDYDRKKLLEHIKNIVELASLKSNLKLKLIHNKKK